MNNLFSKKRRRDSSVDTKDTYLSETLSDRARLIYSAAFRRLQQKAQVFSLENNSSVRSRLTHSIEVSHIGQFIVSKITDLLDLSTEVSEEDKFFWKTNHVAISNIVETACLMHDIGNPPFGHFGEEAIIEWSKSDEIKNALNNSLSFSEDKKNESSVQSELLGDFNYYDGNPQGLRVITRLQGEDGLFGLNLTYTQLICFLKYTCCPKTKKDSKFFNKKVGYFSTEKSIIEDIWKELGMPPHTRHPLGYLMEASDDISYCISDIEDGIEKKIIDIGDFKKFTKDRLLALKNKVDCDVDICNKLIHCLDNDKKTAISNFLSFKTGLSNYLVCEAAKKFVYEFNEVFQMKLTDVLISKDTFSYHLLKILKDYTSRFLFTSDDAECMELSGFAIIKGILLEYTKLLKLKNSDFAHLVLHDNDKIRENNLHIERRLFNRLPKKHVNAYKTALMGMPTNSPDFNNDKFLERISSCNPRDEWKLRAHLVVDFVSGMTDLFSLDMYQLLKGIKVK
ncbi:dGTPase [Morganella morganii]|uniref:dGTPase n=1 Tax=Morganella morganii TaxID=582 RepID=UPI001BD9C7BA|nr:dGTPase [Morganella morganii]ELA8730199.1 dGTPase [Morganella morganii]ELB1850171.1 dGTPase [Morganella morganii]MBT0489246.1 dGTPase [Morganella morganii subsp. morganii]MBT0492634.1 dGTPase [Morganella morganii subsp. morganii]QWL91921.1 dGTPase [Morganella morganii subsp. morganii]